MKKVVFLVSVVILFSLKAYAVSYSPLVQVVPGLGLPPQVSCMRSNNNLDIVRFDGRLFMAFRTAPTHFASTKTTHYIVSSKDEKSWDFEARVAIGADMREPRFLVLGDKLMFYFFEAGKNPLGFTPKHIWAMERKGQGSWTEPVPVFEPGCVLWRAKVRNGTAYATVYCGGAEEYTGGNASIDIYFLTTRDGYNFEPVNEARPVVMKGGSETAFEFDGRGNLYTVIRNEGGALDNMGQGGISWGGKVCKAEPSDISDWHCVVTSNKYDSPLMFRHDDDIYLIARRNIDGAFDKEDRWLPNPIENLYYMARYWWTHKRTALYKLDTVNLKLDPILDFPSRGDTAFPGLVSIDGNHYLMYNYSSDPNGKDRVWMSGQLHKTYIYSTVIGFE